MQVIFLQPDALPSLPNLTLTIGNYDGVHLGHQAMLARLVDGAKTLNLSSAVMVFEPQPREFFYPDDAPARLSSLSEKSKLIAKLGVDYLLVASFDEVFRSLSADAFVQILKQLNVRQLVLGDDFRFGQGRAGNHQSLSEAGFAVENLSSVLVDGRRVSSTLVREALAKGDLMVAKTLLGRDYAITGQVVHGDKIGRTLDFPTANIALNRHKPPLHGVFGADILAFDEQGAALSWETLTTKHGQGVAGVTAGSLFGAVNIGTRPSVSGVDWRLEVHLPQFAGDLYGVHLQVIFLHYLHGERRYDGLHALKLGIHQDVQQLLDWRADQLT